MERLAGAVELLDGPLENVDELADNLRDLRRANRVFGVGLSRKAVARVVAPGGGAMTLIDVGTGGADIPLALLADAARSGRELQVTAIDERPEVLTAAGRTNRTVTKTPGLQLAVADGRSLPYPDESFDVAHCSLVLHHLEPADAVALLREMGRVARGGVVVNDLVRGRLFVLGAWLLSRVATRNRLSRYDAPLSVRRAYSRAELRAFLAEAGLRPVAEFGGFFGHRVAIAAVRR